MPITSLKARSAVALFGALFGDGEASGWPPYEAEPGFRWPPPDLSSDSTIPLYDDMGTMHYSAGPDVPERAQAFFDQGLRFLAAFDIYRGVLSFRAAQRLAPLCAMCIWGESLALGPNLNAFDEPRLLASVPLAFRRAQEAYRLQLRLSSGSADPIAAQNLEITRALVLRFAPTQAEFVEKERVLRQSYAHSIASVADKFQNSSLVRILAAEGWMATHPWDYWLDQSRPRPETGNAIELLESVLREEPNNGWAMHLYVHITEASKYASQALPYARSLPHAFPGAPHTSHMAFHTLMHSGHYAFSERVNLEASEMLRQVYPLHNLDTLTWICRVQGNSRCAMMASARLEHLSMRWAQFPNVFETGFPVSRFGVQHMLTLLAFSRYTEIIDLSPPPDFVDMYWFAIWHFTRGVAAARTKDLALATEQLASLHDTRVAITALGKNSATMPPWSFGNFGGDANWGMFPISAVINITTSELEAEIALASGEAAKAIEMFTQASALESQLPYDEPPTWYLPVASRLGAAMILANNYTGAQRIYSQSLRAFPNNGWVLFGLWQACDKDPRPWSSACRDVSSEFRHAWKHSDVQLSSSAEVSWYSEVVATQPDVFGERPMVLLWLATLGMFFSTLIVCLSCVKVVPQEAFPEFLDSAQSFALYEAF
eukprot:TRINITY_DN23950_c0_g1_i1.p1 TRINITY_DN23950_c0_g1~~TRINITY_DN23950_c0_g1_i1.p1  ORF type:complete len:658 (-),score=35.77 TRINITY_DN23950_c0_g1_i1:91-2064(-)